MDNFSYFVLIVFSINKEFMCLNMTSYVTFKIITLTFASVYRIIQYGKSFVLQALEETDAKGSRAQALGLDLPLFAALTPPPAVPSAPGTSTPEGWAEVVEAVADLDPDDMTPKEALDALYRLRTLHRMGVK